MKDNVAFKVFRFDPTKDKTPRFDYFDVPLSALRNKTVLEGLIYIQETLDGSLSYRSSCREGVCGSCAMYVGKSYALACETQIGALGSGPILIRPLGHLPILKDLVVDMGPFWARYEEIKPYLIPGGPAPERERIQSPDEREKLNIIVDCILCAACYGSCTVTDTDPEYLGPAALAKACRFTLDSRDNATAERLAIVGGEHGVWRCHTIFSCQEVCPKDVDPTGAIAVLKRKAIGMKFGKRYDKARHA
jgi:succinate dehydrogenase / fumarate reductase iron-sulfur subunit